MAERRRRRWWGKGEEVSRQGVPTRMAQCSRTRHQILAREAVMYSFQTARPASRQAVTVKKRAFLSASLHLASRTSTLASSRLMAASSVVGTSKPEDTASRRKVSSGAALSGAGSPGSIEHSMIVSSARCAEPKTEASFTAACFQAASRTSWRRGQVTSTCVRLQGWSELQSMHETACRSRGSLFSRSQSSFHKSVPSW